MAKIAPAVTLTDPDRAQLQQWARAHFTPQQVALRSRILLLAAEGQENREIATELKVNRHTPALWRQRFIQDGLAAVWETPSGRGRKPAYPPEKVAAIVQATLQTKPKGAAHWSCPTMARSQRVRKNTVNRLWQEYNLKPHRSRTFKVSRDPKFLEKLTDGVGLYLNPPDKTLVLCVDEEKSDSSVGPHPARFAAQEGAGRPLPP
jgi:transposase